jgi:hypothetical protein
MADLPPCLITRHVIKEYKGVEVYLHLKDPTALPLGKSSRFPFIRKLSGLQGRSGSSVESKNIPHPNWESNIDFSVVQPVT